MLLPLTHIIQETREKNVHYLVKTLLTYIVILKNMDY